MNKDEFLQAIVNFDKEHIPEATIKTIKEEFLKYPELNPEFVRTKSSVAAGFCAWVINVIKFHKVRILIIIYGFTCLLKSVFFNPLLTVGLEM